MVLRAPRRADFRKITNLSSMFLAAVRQAQSGAEPCRSTAPMKILIVEDEPKTGDYLQQGLAESGFVVDLARNGVDGLHLAVTGDHDLLVLDVMLPGLNGWQVLETLRRSGKEIPVLFLTARDQVEDRVRGLELGFDKVEQFSVGHGGGGHFEHVGSMGAQGEGGDGQGGEGFFQHG